MKSKPFELDLPNKTKLCINENKQRIYIFFGDSGSIRIKIREIGPYNIIKQIDGFKGIFP